jgi:hypothetical protein
MKDSNPETLETLELPTQNFYQATQRSGLHVYLGAGWFFAYLEDTLYDLTDNYILVNDVTDWPSLYFVKKPSVTKGDVLFYSVFKDGKVLGIPIAFLKK